MKENIRSIQFLRFIAASLVVAFHLVHGLSKYYTGSVSSEVTYFAAFGAVGVHIFFVISGFVMVYTSFGIPRANFQQSKFFIRRFIRIYPIYWFYVTIYLLFHSTIGQGYALSPGSTVGAFLLLPGDSALIIGPGWTLSFEVYFYLCFGLAMVLGLQRGLVALTGFFISLVALRYILKINIDQQYLHVFTNSLLLEFLAGAWIAYLVVHGVKISTRIANIMLFVGVILFAAGIAYGYSRLPSVVMWGIPSALIVAGCVFRERNGNISETVKRYAWLGDSSYSLYLLHILLIDIMLMIAISIYPTFGTFEMVVACAFIFVLNVLIAALLYALVERRIVIHLQNIVKTRLSWLMGANQPV